MFILWVGSQIAHVNIILRSGLNPMTAESSFRVPNRMTEICGDAEAFHIWRANSDNFYISELDKHE